MPHKIHRLFSSFIGISTALILVVVVIAVIAFLFFPRMQGPGDLSVDPDQWPYAADSVVSHQDTAAYYDSGQDMTYYDPDYGYGVGSSSQGDSPGDYKSSSGKPFSKESFLSRVDSVLSGKFMGNIAFNVPDTEMAYGATAGIQLLLSATQTLEKLEERVTYHGTVESHTIRISDIMEATLTGEGFQILAVNPERQAVSAYEGTEWKWEVTAIKPGPQRLHLTLNMILSYDGEMIPRAIKSFDREIMIRVSVQQRIAAFFHDNWQWVWTVIFIPLGGGIWKFVKSRRKKREDRHAGFEH